MKFLLNTSPIIFTFFLAISCFTSSAQEERGYKNFQFPPNMIPRIDGDTSDWNIFPEQYVTGTGQCPRLLKTGAGNHYARRLKVIMQ